MAAGKGVQLDREVAVGVPDSPERDEATYVKARLLPKFPSGRGLGPLARLDATTRELPETREEAGRRSALNEPPAVVGQDHDRGTDVRAASTTRPFRQGPWVLELTVGAARERERAARARWPDRTTDRLPQLHDGLVERAGVRAG